MTTHFPSHRPSDPRRIPRYDWELGRFWIYGPVFCEWVHAAHLLTPWPYFQPCPCPAHAMPCLPGNELLYCTADACVMCLR